MVDVLYLFGFVVFLDLLRRAQVAHRLHSVSLPREIKELDTIESMEGFELSMLQEPREELEAIGFRFSHVENFLRVENSVLCRQRELVFYHETLDAAAFLATHIQPEPNKTYNLSFHTDEADGACVLSVDAPGLFHVFPSRSFRVLSIYSLCPREHWDRFQKSAGEISVRNSEPTLSEQLTGRNAIFSAWLEEQCDKKRMRRSEEGFSVTPLGAFLGASGLLSAMQRSTSEQAARKKNLQSDEPKVVPVEAEIASYELLSAMNGRRTLRKGGKFLLLLVTAGMFFLSFGWKLSIQSVSILLLVVFFHELGHIAAMKFFGYRDLKILFVPFLGAVALGRQKNVPTHQKVIVALAGPIPGLLLGICLYAFFGTAATEKDSILLETTWALIGLNFFNLLPVMPLDGGQVLHALVFSRLPSLEAIFGIGGGLLLGLAGFWLAEPVVAFVALLILVSSREQVRRSRLLYSLRKKLKQQEDLSEQACVREAFLHISAQSPKNMSFMRRYQLADYLVSNVRTSFSGFRQTAGLLLLYAVSLLIFPVAVILIHWQHPLADSSSADELTPVERIEVPTQPVVVREQGLEPIGFELGRKR